MACWPLQRFETVCVLMLALLFVLGCHRSQLAQNRKPVLSEHKRIMTTHVFRGSVSSLSIQDDLIAQ
jgi:hypothetical protein